MYVHACMYIWGFGYMHEREYASVYTLYHTSPVRVGPSHKRSRARVCGLHVVGRVTSAHDLAVHQSPLL